MRTTVPDQVEFDIAATPIQLKLAFALAVRGVLALFNNRQIRFDQRVGHALHHGKTLLGAKFLKIVKKHATDAALLMAMLEVKVFVAPLFKTWVFVSAKRLQRIFAGLVKMHGIFVKSIIRCQIKATAKPAHCSRAVGGHGGQYAHVHMHRGDIRVARVKHQ